MEKYQMQRISAHSARRRPGVTIDRLAPERPSPGPRYMRDGPDVVVLSESLEPVRRRRVNLSRMRLRDASDDLERLILSDALELVLIFGAEATHIDVKRVDSALFLPDGRVLVTAPQKRDSGRGRSKPLRHRVCLIDPQSGTVVDEQELKVTEAIVGMYMNPQDGSVVLDAGEGQDGSHLFAAFVNKNELKIKKIARDGVFGSFSPSGDRLLLLPHPMSDEPVTIRAWPSLKKIATLDIDDVELDEDDGFDIEGFHLHDDLIILKTLDGNLLACSGDLKPRAWIDATIPLDQDGELNITGMIGLTKNTLAIEAFEAVDGPTISIYHLSLA